MLVSYRFSPNVARPRFNVKCDTHVNFAVVPVVPEEEVTIHSILLSFTKCHKVIFHQLKVRPYVERHLVVNFNLFVSAAQFAPWVSGKPSLSDFTPLRRTSNFSREFSLNFIFKKKIHWDQTTLSSFVFEL